MSVQHETHSTRGLPRVIEQALDRAGGNQAHAARTLWITPGKLRYKIKKHNLR